MCHSRGLHADSTRFGGLYCACVLADGSTRFGLGFCDQKKSFLMLQGHKKNHVQICKGQGQDLPIWKQGYLEYTVLATNLVFVITFVW